MTSMKDRIGKECTFGANVNIGEEVTIGNNNYFGDNISIHGKVTIGNGNYFSDFISIGRPSQHRTHRFEFQKPQTGEIKIGNDNVFREFITIHLPTKNESIVEDRCYLMAYNHLPHDIHISKNVVLANDCQIGGHTYIGKHSYLGLSNTIHPRITIGDYTRIGMQSIITSDVPPGLLAYGSPIIAKKIDVEHLTSNGFTEIEIKEIIEFYQAVKTKEDMEKNINLISSINFQNSVSIFIKKSTKQIIMPENEN